MLFSYNKLIELANLKATPEEVSSAITSIGFEVEGIENFSKVEGIKFGKVLELSKNPNDNKLTVVKIMFDNGNKIIQTTATNLKLNDVVIAFVPGSSNGEFTFSSKELKGVLSEGMLSNINEFGIKKDLLPEYMYEGIGTFNEINDLSIDPIEYLGLNDFIIEVSVLSNRSDVNSYLIMARELSSYFETEVNFNFEDLKVSGKTKNSFSFKEHELSKISLVETSENISLNMKQKMMIIKSGITLNKNDMINVSNLIFILSGQPTHVYDSEILNSKILEVKKINGKANILGNKIVEFNNSQVIFDGKEAVSVAGIVGIQKFSVSDKTKKYLFEFGIFNNYEVRKTSKMIKTNTNSGNQSGKKLGLGTKEIAIKILSILLKGNHSTVFYNYKNKPKKTFFIKYEYLNKIAGEDFRKNKKFPDLIKKLTKLGFIF
ncbi:MAG: phenylalanine--tRNA ligase subunit beta, partial [Mollicutes bacterium PWAP]|nr:phenylalanine--tRNA ligase subunit beta [Mollicutes bacterium PWAP]